MNIEPRIPPLRDLSSGRLSELKEQLLADVGRDHRRRNLRVMDWRLPGGRVAMVAVALGLVTIGTAVAATTTGWLIGDPAPSGVVSDFDSYAPELGFSPEPGRAVLVASDGDTSLYATTNKQGTYCLLASAPWKRPSASGEGGTCIARASAAAPLIAGLVGARSTPGAQQTYLIAGRSRDPEARMIRFTDFDGNEITRDIGSSGFFLAAVETESSLCGKGVWEPRFRVLDAEGEQRSSATITLAKASPSSPGVCAFAPPHP